MVRGKHLFSFRLYSDYLLIPLPGNEGPDWIALISVFNACISNKGRVFNACYINHNEDIL